MAALPAADACPNRRIPNPPSANPQSRARRCSPSPTAPSRTASIVLRDGKIAALGANVPSPPAPRSSTPAAGSSQPGDHRRALAHRLDAINEGGTTVSSMTNRGRARPDRHQHLPRPRGRPHVANVLHGSANPIGGKNTVIKLRWGKTRAGGPGLRGRDARGSSSRSARTRRTCAVRRRHAAPLPRQPARRRVRHPRRLHARQGVPEGVAGVREGEGRPGGRAGAAPRPPARAAGRDARGASASRTRTPTAPTRC
jgi:hypothetical protein